jgi:aspartate 1-decarboxylase
MMRIVARAKLHGLRITDTQLNYGGSLTLDADLMAAADILAGERAQIVSLSNGSRIETYAIEGEAGSGVCVPNGPAARMGEVGDTVHVIVYGIAEAGEETRGLPRTIQVDEHNRVRS